MSGRPVPNLLLRRTTAASLAIHAVLILLPAALLESLGSGASPGPPSEDAGFVVSLYPVPEESPADLPAEPEPEPEPVPESLPVPEEPEPEPEPVAPPEPEGSEEPVPSSSARPAPAAGGRTAEPGDAGGEPGPGEPGESARFQPPRLLAGALPIDPEDSGELDVPDEIPVRLRVGKKGMVIEVVPAVPDLSAPVLAAIERSARAMRFAPARRGKKPVEAWFTMTFVYRR